MIKKIIDFIVSLFCKTPKEDKDIPMAEPKITKEELERAGDPITEEFQDAFNTFLEKINIFREKCGLPMSPTSYFRSKERQLRIYREKAEKHEFPFEDGVFKESKVPMGSAHMSGLACDFADANKKLANWVLDNIDWCKDNGYYFENFGADINTYEKNIKLDKTPSWLHIQIIPPKSGRTIFNP